MLHSIEDEPTAATPNNKDVATEIGLRERNQTGNIKLYNSIYIQLKTGKTNQL